MTDKKVNLQALFDEQALERPNKHYILVPDSLELMSKKAKQRLKDFPEKSGLIYGIHNEEHRANMIKGLQARKGIPLSEEHRANLSKAQKGRILSEEHKQRQSEGQKKRWEENPYIATEEVIKKRSEGIKKSWAERKANAEPKPPKAVEPPKKRGRPRTRPLPDPNQAPKRRGRPPKVSSH